MIEQLKINSVREYIESEFSGYKIEDEYDDERLSQKFRISDTSTFYSVKFERVFLDDIPDVIKLLQLFELGKFMRSNSGKQILVTKKGLKIITD